MTPALAIDNGLSASTEAEDNGKGTDKESSFCTPDCPHVSKNMLNHSMGTGPYSIWEHAESYYGHTMVDSSLGVHIAPWAESPKGKLYPGENAIPDEISLMNHSVDEATDDNKANEPPVKKHNEITATVEDDLETSVHSKDESLMNPCATVANNGHDVAKVATDDEALSTSSDASTFVSNGP